MVHLMYHDIVTREDTSSGFQNSSAFQYKVEAGKFEAQVRELAGKEEVTFTFDDGGVSFLTVAAPILEAYGRRGIFFISTKYLGTPGFLTAEQVRELEKRGHKIGSHSHSHPDNIAALSRKEMDEEWRESVGLLEAILGHRVEVASIPNGYGSKQLDAAAMEAGIRELYTSVPTTKALFSHGLRMIGRYVVHRDMTVEDVVAMVEDGGHRRKMYLRWYVLSLAKKMLGSNYDKLKARFVK